MPANILEAIAGTAALVAFVPVVRLLVRARSELFDNDSDQVADTDPYLAGVAGEALTTSEERN